jgi:PAS domain S-box-containing protein
MQMDNLDSDKVRFLYEQLEELTGAGIWELTLEDKKIFWSDNVFRILGYEPQEFQVTNAKSTEIIHPDDRLRSAELMEDVLQNGAEYFIRKRLLSKEGNIIHVHSKAKVFRNKTGKPIKLIGLFQDITELKETEKDTVNSIYLTPPNKDVRRFEAIELSERRLKSLVQEGSELIGISDLEGNYKYASPNSISILGLDPEAFVGKNAFDFIHPEDKQRVMKKFEMLKTRERVKLTPFRFKSKNGEWRWFEAQLSNLMNDASVQGIVSNCRDVTERIEIELKLKEEKERLELVMKAGSGSIWDYDVQKEILYVGEGYQKKYDLNGSGKMTTLQMHDALVHPDDFPDFKIGIQNALKNPEVSEWKDTYRLKKRDGEYARVSDRAIILRDQKGRAVRAVGSIKDVSLQFLNSELGELEKKLMENSIKAETPIHQFLHDFLSGIDSLFQGMKSSLTSIEKNNLQNLISPNLPAEYLNEIEGLSIGKNKGSCGTAAYLKKQVIAKDIANDERWKDYTALAEKYGFKSCWSEPIFNEANEVIATFAIYHDTVKTPEDLDIDILERGSRLISLILQNSANVKSIKDSHERFTYVNKATNNAIYDWDIKNDRIDWGDSLSRAFGHQLTYNTCDVNQWTEWIHPDDRKNTFKTLQTLLSTPNKSKYEAEYRFQSVKGKYSYVEDIGYIIRDEFGQPERMIGALRDETVQKEAQIKQELQYELSQHFSKGKELNQALEKSLKYLSNFGGYEAGEIWLMSRDQKSLRFSSFYAKNNQIEGFYSKKAVDSLKKGECLVGNVWKSLKHEVWNDIHLRTDFTRNQFAQNAKLKSAVAYPLVYREKIIGVMAFFSKRQLNEPSQELMFNPLEQYLGAEIMRKQQEEELNLFFENAPEILAIASTEGNFIKANPAFCQLLGYSEEELIGRPPSEFLHADDVTKTHREFTESLKGNQNANNFINRYRTKESGYRWISWSYASSSRSGGSVFCYGRDVTEMLEMQQYLENATKLARVGAWEINQLTGEHSWSQLTKEIHEVNHDFNPNTESALSFYHPAFRKRVSRALKLAIETGEPFDFEALIITQKGNDRWIRAIGATEISEGKCIRIYGSFQDIHDRKLIELRLENISNNIPGVLFQYQLNPDRTDEIKFISKGALDIWGYDANKILENNDLIWSGIRKTGDAEQLKETIIQSSEELSRWHSIWRYEHPDGTTYWHEGFGNPNKTTDGTTVWDSLVVDITEKKRAEEQIKLANETLANHARELEISNTELEQFAYVASHDLQEPLRMVSGFLSLLQKKYGDQLDAKAHGYIDFAVDGAKRMRQIILDLLDYSKVGKSEEELTEVDLNKIVDEVCLLQRKQIELLGASINYENLPQVTGHAAPLLQIFSNLISNALKYSRKDVPPKISIHAKAEKNEWKFAIKDNGIGIEKEYSEKIFNIFQRLHNKTEYSGTGMGLAIVKKIIENLNGSIWVNSDGKNGSTFYFTLPKS